MKIFCSCFAPRLEEYVALRRRLGCQFKGQEDILHAFDRFAAGREHRGSLTTELALDFAAEDPAGPTLQHGRRYQVVRNFADYLATFEPGTPALDPKAIRTSKTRPPAHIYTQEQLARLLQASRCISRRHPIRGATVHAMVGLAVSAGLRVGEVVRLDRADVDLGTAVLTVRRSKFFKDRLVPLHPTTQGVLTQYVALRDAHHPSPATSAFFITLRGSRYVNGTVDGDFRRLCIRCGLRPATGKGPRFHDLRHTFAVNRLIGWYREGKDVQAMLPVLATYLGHAHYSDTAWYLQATSELLGIALERVQKAAELPGGVS